MRSMAPLVPGVRRPDCLRAPGPCHDAPTDFEVPWRGGPGPGGLTPALPEPVGRGRGPSPFGSPGRPRGLGITVRRMAPLSRPRAGLGAIGPPASPGLFLAAGAEPCLPAIWSTWPGQGHRRRVGQGSRDRRSHARLGVLQVSRPRAHPGVPKSSPVACPGRVVLVHSSVPTVVHRSTGRRCLAQPSSAHPWETRMGARACPGQGSPPTPSGAPPAGHVDHGSTRR